MGFYYAARQQCKSCMRAAGALAVPCPNSRRLRFYAVTPPVMTCLTVRVLLTIASVSSIEYWLHYVVGVRENVESRLVTLSPVLNGSRCIAGGRQPVELLPLPSLNCDTTVQQ